MTAKLAKSTFLTAGLLCGAMLTGCAHKAKTPATAPAALEPTVPAPVATYPDRGWTESVAVYPSNSVPTFPTYWTDYNKVAARSDCTNVWLSPLEFLGDIVLMPVRMVMQKPGTVVMTDPMQTTPAK